MPEGYERSHTDRSDKDDEGVSEDVLGAEQVVDADSDPEQILMARQEAEKNGDEVE